MPLLPALQRQRQGDFVSFGLPKSQAAQGREGEVVGCHEIETANISEILLKMIHH